MKELNLISIVNPIYFTNHTIPSSNFQITKFSNQFIESQLIQYRKSNPVQLEGGWHLK